MIAAIDLKEIVKQDFKDNQYVRENFNRFEALKTRAESEKRYGLSREIEDHQAELLASGYETQGRLAKKQDDKIQFFIRSLELGNMYARKLIDDEIFRN